MQVNLLRIFFLLGLVTLFQPLSAQVGQEPYSYQHFQKYNQVLYSPTSRLHTASKPLLPSAALTERMDSIKQGELQIHTDPFWSKFFNEHQVAVNQENFTFYGDFLPDVGVGKEFGNGANRSTWLGSFGLQVGGTIHQKLSFYANVFQNRAVLPTYLDDYSRYSGVIPGQGYAHHLAGNVKDWRYATARVTYDVSPYLQATLAYDKNHIGDGYRSLLLSDFSANYGQLKLSGNIGNVQYTSVIALMNDPHNARLDSLAFSSSYGDGKKWGVFQYFDYNATNRLSVGFFQSITWANSNEAGKRGFDFNYINPFIFLRPVESSNARSPDKMFLGLNAKYKALANVSIYGQFLLGEFSSKDFFSGKGYAHNKWGAQIGARGFDLFKVKNLNFLAEYNVVRPYTYQHFTSISNYSNNGEALAHPRGANFKELLALVNYSWKRWDFSVEGMYTLYGTDPADHTNYGSDIFQSYTSIPNLYGNFIGQGIKNNLYFADVKAAYVLNPAYNLRLEVGYSQRYHKQEEAKTSNVGIFSVGLRSSFRNFYGDI